MPGSALVHRPLQCIERAEALLDGGDQAFDFLMQVPVTGRDKSQPKGLLQRGLELVLQRLQICVESGSFLHVGSAVTRAGIAEVREQPGRTPGANRATPVEAACSLATGAAAHQGAGPAS